jgi:predicted PurR-regulated permease PerM
MRGASGTQVPEPVSPRSRSRVEKRGIGTGADVGRRRRTFTGLVPRFRDPGVHEIEGQSRVSPRAGSRWVLGAGAELDPHPFARDDGGQTFGMAVDARPRPGVRPRDVWTVLWVTLLVTAALAILYSIRRTLLWLVIAAFFAAVLSPLVTLLVRRGLKRGLAVAAVSVGLFLVGAGLTYAFVRPLVQESIQFAQNLPETVDKVRSAPLVEQVLRRFNIENRVSTVSKDLPRRLIGLSGPLLSAFRTIGELVVAGITIAVLTIFLLLYGPQFVEGGLELIGDPERQARVQRVGEESLRAVSGWVAGNVLTSLIASVASMIAFLALGLPYAVLLGLWVGVADLIPLVGATLGAVPAIVVAFIHSTPAGIVVTVFFVVYQQFENHVLQPAVYGRTIRLNPFLVLVAVLVGIELLGFVGALLALPVAGIIQVIVADILNHRQQRLAASPAEARLVMHDR